MVSTRGQRPSTVGAGNISANDADIASSTAAGTLGGTFEGDSSTTTTRLRKRRRTQSPAEDIPVSASKRSNPRKVLSPKVKRGALVDNNAKPSRKPTVSATAHQELRIADHVTANSIVEGTENDDAPGSGEGPQDIQPAAEALGLSNARYGNGITATSPDMNTVISQIIDHGQTIDNQYGSGSHDTAGLAGPHGTFPAGASLQLKIQSLPVLDNLAIQVLATFAKSSYQEILALTSDAGSEPGAAYSTLKSLFDHTKKVYSVMQPFLSPPELGFGEPMQIDIIRKANLATFVSSVFGSQDVGFYHLNEFFLETFLADGARLLKTQAGLFLDLKTQAYISAIANGERSREDILQDLFPEDMEQHLLTRRSAKQLSPGEADFIQRANNRRKTLLEEPMTVESIAQLPEKYLWENFLRDISTYVSKNFATITGSSLPNVFGTPRVANAVEGNVAQQPKRSGPRKPPQGSIAPEVDVALPATETFTTRVAQMVPTNADDIAEKAARAAEFAMQDFSITQDTADPTQGDDPNLSQQQPQQYPFQFEQQPAPYYTQTQFTNEPQPQPQLQQQQPVDMAQAQNAYVSPSPLIPYPTQSAPTSVLYERARMAATAKTSPSNRRAGHPSQRRPWTQEEENALMAGLDHVKGPHWSQILAMYGAGGTLNETLKDRNQVQLKDKARNLKLFFLKSGIEVPYYLQFVTGELKTRAPQAARQAEQRESSARRQQAGRAEVEQQQQQVQSEGVDDGGEMGMEMEGAVVEDAGLDEEGGEMDGGQQAVDGAAAAAEIADQDANMEDGEGEIIDPEEYAAVHEAGGNQDGGVLGQEGPPGMDYPDPQAQLAIAQDGS
ncbi:MAG: hypothetical protein Q9219_006941 [cf. Caloplaca sp. 3 TL-2023]